LQENIPQYFSEGAVKHLRFHLKAARLTLEDMGLSEAKIQSLRLQHYKHYALMTWIELSQLSEDLYKFTQLLNKLEDFAQKARTTLDELGISEEKIDQIRFRQL